ncbi:MAG: hypothetical protein Q8L48_00430 [Archangium sp.]|nr:hypothetical protein [Archangium sp.]
MKQRALSLCFLLLTSCVCGTATESRDYFCTASDQCVAGYHCDASAQLCVADGTGGGGGSADAAVEDAGTDAGTEDAGVQDAGAQDAGSDAGTKDAGTDAGVDAGTTRDAGGLLGGVCTLNSDCQNNRCIDGRCCADTCNGPCDFCDVPGQEGRCRPGQAGRTPAPACPGNYACTGLLTSCSAICTTDAGCVNSRCGAGGVCIQKLAQLKDDFNSGGFDASVWDQVDLSCAVVNQRFQVRTTPASTFYPTIHARQRYDLLDSELRVDLINPGDQTLPSMQAFAGGCDYATGTRCLQIIVSSGYLIIQLADNATYTTILGDVPLAGRQSLRMREQTGRLFLEAKDDAGTWAEIESMPTPFRSDFMDMSIDIGAGTYMPEPAASTVIWDNVNLP